MGHLPPMDKYVGMDCEMVGIKGGQALAKIGMVDHTGAVLLESFVFVHPLNVTDWRTDSSGIRQQDMRGAPTFDVVQKKVKELVKDKIIVGHAVFNDLAAVQHRHPYPDVRDTACYVPLRKMAGVTRDGDYPSLKKLAALVLGKDIQKHEHCPVEDARAAMLLFMTVRRDFEEALARGDDPLMGIPPSFEKWYW